MRRDGPTARRLPASDILMGILAHLTGGANFSEISKPPTKAPRDSAAPLRRDSPVINYKNDRKTREFFKSQIGPDFHFTYHVNQYRLANDGLTYGDLIDEWVAERDRRENKSYTPKNCRPRRIQSVYPRLLRRRGKPGKNHARCGHGLEHGQAHAGPAIPAIVDPRRVRVHELCSDFAAQNQGYAEHHRGSRPLVRTAGRFDCR